MQPPRLRLPSSKNPLASVAFFLLLQALLLFLLLHLLLLLFLCLLRSLLLTGFDVRLVLLCIDLLLREVLRTFGALLRILRRVAPGLVELALEIGLLAIVCRLIGGPLRRLGIASRFVQRMLALLVLVRLLVAGGARRTLRGLRGIAFAPQRVLLVALPRMHGTALVVQRQLLGPDLRAHLAHLVARPVDARVDEEFAIAVMHGNAVRVLVLGRAIVERLLTRAEIGRARRRRIARDRCRRGLPFRHGLRARGHGHAKRHGRCRRGQYGGTQGD